MALMVVTCVTRTQTGLSQGGILRENLQGFVIGPRGGCESRGEEVHVNSRPKSY